jgi:hypothetical protein
VRSDDLREEKINRPDVISHHLVREPLGSKGESARGGADVRQIQRWTLLS